MYKNKKNEESCWEKKPTWPKRQIQDITGGECSIILNFAMNRVAIVVKQQKKYKLLCFMTRIVNLSI